MVLVKIRRKANSSPVAGRSEPKPSNPLPPIDPLAAILLKNKANEEAGKFMEAMQKIREQPGRLRIWLRQRYEEELGCPPADSISNEALVLRVGYAILMRGHREAGIEPSQKIKERARNAERREDYEAEHPECVQMYIIPFASPQRIGHNKSSGSNDETPTNEKKEKRTMAKTTKQTKSAPEPEASGKRPVGATTGLGVIQAWCHIFEKNQKAQKSKRLTDPQITEWLRNEFPGRDSAIFEKVQGVRNRYNHGGLTGGVAPETTSTQFDAAGNVLEVRRGKKAEAPAPAPSAKASKTPAPKATTPAPTAKATVKVKKTSKAK